MKRYISAILIPCLLMQFVGCYSFRSITLEELKQFEGDNDIILTTNKGEVIINRNEEVFKTMNWVAKDSSLYIEKIESVPIGDNENIRRQHTTNQEIGYNDIESIQVKSSDVLGTIGLTAATLIVFYILIWGISTGFDTDFR
jgi:hypothetical protein